MPDALTFDLLCPMLNFLLPSFIFHKGIKKRAEKKKKKKHARVSEFFPSEPVLKPVFAVVEVLF